MIDRRGRVLSMRVIEGSGDSAYDEAALEMIRRSDPVPQPPPMEADEGLNFIAGRESSRRDKELIPQGPAPSPRRDLPVCEFTGRAWPAPDILFRGMQPARGVAVRMSPKIVPSPADAAPRFGGDRGRSRSAFARQPVVWLVAAAGRLVHAATAGRYDAQRNELYFLVCGWHPDFGYVDQPPLVPLIAAATQLFGVNIWLCGCRRRRGGRAGSCSARRSPVCSAAGAGRSAFAAIAAALRPDWPGSSSHLTTRPSSRSPAPPPPSC